MASIFYGHKKVYLVIGENKLEKDYDRALWRARNIASPLNAKRVGAKTPCAVKGDKCYDCKYAFTESFSITGCFVCPVSYLILQRKSSDVSAGLAAKLPFSQAPLWEKMSGTDLSPACREHAVSVE